MERYKLEIVNDDGDQYIRCEPATDGSWVMFKDVGELQACIAQLEAALQEIVKRTRHAHPMSYVGDYYRIAQAALAGGKKDD